MNRLYGTSDLYSSVRSVAAGSWDRQRNHYDHHEDGGPYSRW